MSKLKWENINVLVVDDNAFIRNLIVTTLRTLGLTSITDMGSASEAIDRLKLSRKDPIAAGLGTMDIVFSDFVMAQVDGLLFLRWVRTSKDAPDRFVPFVMVSGAADQEAVESARDAGLTEFLAKPFSAKSLSDRVLDVIQMPRQFVLAPGYFGPDRRRRDRPTHWGASDAAAGEEGQGVQDRRTTKASQIQVVHAFSNVRTLRDDVRAVYFRPANRLRDKLGPNALRGQIDFDPLVIQAAEAKVQELVGDYSVWVQRYVEQISEAYRGLCRGQGAPHKHLMTIHSVAHELRGQGNIFDYPLISAFGKTLCEATTDSNAEITEKRLKLLEAHIDGIRLVFNNQVRGDGGEVGAALLKDIETAVKKYSEPKKAHAKPAPATPAAVKS
jgi:CheY-like chemotaxis protein